MTYKQAKDKIAKKYGYPKWASHELEVSQTHNRYDLMDEAAELYASDKVKKALLKAAAGGDEITRKSILAIGDDNVSARERDNEGVYEQALRIVPESVKRKVDNKIKKLAERDNEEVNKAFAKVKFAKDNFGSIKNLTRSTKHEKKKKRLSD